MPAEGQVFIYIIGSHAAQAPKRSRFAREKEWQINHRKKGFTLCYFKAWAKFLEFGRKQVGLRHIQTLFRCTKFPVFISKCLVNAHLCPNSFAFLTFADLPNRSFVDRVHTSGSEEIMNDGRFDLKISAFPFNLCKMLIPLLLLNKGHCWNHWIGLIYVQHCALFWRTLNSPYSDKWLNSLKTRIFQGQQCKISKGIDSLLATFS